MPQILAVLSPSGGSGKTFVAKAIAEYSARYCGRRTLAVDLDPQASLSLALMDMKDSGQGFEPPLHPAADGTWSGHASSAELLKGSMVAYESTVGAPERMLEVACASCSGLRQIERIAASPDLPAGILRANLLDLAAEYDTIVLDTPHAGDWLKAAALRAATHVLVPFSNLAGQAEGLEHIAASVAAENAVRESHVTPLQILGFLPNRVRSGGMSDHDSAALRGMQPQTRERIIQPGLPDGRYINTWSRPLEHTQSMFGLLAGAPSGFERALHHLGSRVDAALHGSGQGSQATTR